MGAQTPMGEGAKFIITTEDFGVLHAYLDNGNGEQVHIAMQPRGSDPEQFHWLIRSAAAFHNLLPVEKR